MKKQRYASMDRSVSVSRREFVKAAGLVPVVGSSLVLGSPAFADQTEPPPVETNLADFMKVPRSKHSLPGPFPGKVVKVTDRASVSDTKVDGKVVARMVEKGLTTLTGRDPKGAFTLLFEPTDIVGIKVNPVGPPLIHTKPELTEAVIAWLVASGLPKQNIVIWDRFDYMLTDAGYTAARFPGIAIEGLQTMDESGNKWRDAQGNHLSVNNFDREVFFHVKNATWQGDRNHKNEESYLNQHVFNGEYLVLRKLLTKRLTKIINLAAYKNTGHGISMATKNMGYGSVCNTGRLHAPLGLDAGTQVMAGPVVRDKLVLNITDGLVAQYDGGPDKNAQFVYDNHSLYFATDPFALDMACHDELVAKRKEMKVTVNEHPRFTEYLRHAESLGLGVVDAAKLKIVKA